MNPSQNDKNAGFESLLKDEFQAFTSAAPFAPPRAAASAVVEEIHRDLSPAPWSVLVRLFGIATCAGAFTLLFCPHFGLGIGDMFGAMGFIMRFGENFCQTVCGSIFAGSGVLIASTLLRPEELRTIRDHRTLQLTAVSCSILGLFFCAGAAVFSTLGLFWLIGSICGGLLSFEIGWRVRFFILELTT